MSTLLRDRSVIKQFIPAIIIFFAIFTVLPGIVRGQPITEGFNNFDTGTRPAGWTFYGCNANSDTYTAAGDFGLASPSVMFNADTDYIQTLPLFHPDELRFWVKGMGTDASSELLVEEYYSGSGWNTLTNVVPLPAAGTNFGPYSMDFFATEARFTYTKSAGDIALDDVDISKAVPTPTPSVTPSITPVTPTPTLTPLPTATPTPNTDIPNPSFELGTGTDVTDPILGWTRVADKPYVARSTDQAYDGTYSCTFSATGYITTKYTDQGIRSGEVFSIIGGDDYDIGGWFYVLDEGGAIGDTLFKFNIEWLSGGIVVKTDSDSDWTLAAFNIWENKEYRETAPASADQVRIYIAAMEENNPNSDVFIDYFYVTHAPAITVTAPELNDPWFINTAENITWISYGLTGNIDIHYNTDGGPWTVVDTNVADTGTYPWTIFADPSDQALVRVQEAGGGISGESDQFIIAERDSIHVTSPDGGETWYRTVNYDITWEYGPDVGSACVDLDYSVDNGTSWTSITSCIPIGSSPYSWTIPNRNSDLCLVRVRQPSSGISGQSPAVFTMAAPTFSITAPAAGETWYWPDTNTITWTSNSGIPGNVSVDYSTTGRFGPWTQIQGNWPNSGSCPWSVPNTSSTTCRIRISDISGIGLPGVSADDFTLEGISPPQEYIPLTWSVLETIDTTCSLRAITVYGNDNSNIWVPCSCGIIYYYNGVDWVVQSEIRANMADIVAISPDDVWTGGEQGAIFHYSGGGTSGWEWQGEIDNYIIYSIDAPDKDHVMLGLEANEVAMWTPAGGWNRYNMAELGSTVRGVLYLRPNLAFMVDGATAYYNSFMYFSDDGGTTWQEFGSFGAQDLNDRPLAGCLDQNGDPLLWLVGDCGYIYHKKPGSEWAEQTRAQNYVNWNSVVALDENNVWASASGILMHYNGSEWIVESTKMPTFKQMVAIDNRHVYAIGDSATNKKIYIGTADPSPTPFISVPPTPFGQKTPSPTPVPVPGPISGKVYDRVTGIGISNLYVRALPTESGLIPAGGRTGSDGSYNITGLDAGLYYMYVDSNDGSGVRLYRSQWYNQKDIQADASSVGSNSSGINFPLYKSGIYPTPAPTATPDFQVIRVASGDYSGDGYSDIAIFRQSSGLWAVRAVTRLYFGASGDLPTSGDYDGDGTADVALFRGSSGLWAIRNVSRVYFGRSSDLTVPGDYDGDGSCDIGIFRNGSSLWAIRGITRNYFGGSSDEPVSCDYDGDGSDDIAIFRGSSGLWALKDISRIYYGNSSDTPVPGDYTGSGGAVPAVFRGSSGLWSVRNLTRVYFGSAADQAVPADYTGAADIAIFRPSTGLWALRGITRVYFGSSDDLPATK